MTGSFGDSVEDRILAAAVADLKRVGPKRFSVVAVAAAAGMTHANVYRYFATKTALMDAVLAQWLRPLEARLAEIVDAPDPADDKLERLLTLLSRAYAQRKAEEPWRFLLLSAVPEGVEARRHKERVAALLLRVCDEGAATRVFPRGEARRNAQLVLDLSHRFLAPAALVLAEGEEGASETRRDRTIRATVAAVTRGL